jgi:TPR repeat protein
MNETSKRRRVDPSAPETPGGDDRALGGGGLAARVRELEELLEATRTELGRKKEKLAAAEATIAAYAKIYPTFDADEQLSSAVFSHVTDVRTRVALAQVNTVWRNASKVASSLPASLDFTGCPLRWNENMSWKTKCEYILGIEGVLDLPETRFHALLEQAGADLSNTNEQCNLGFFYDSSKRYDKALEWYMKGARQGSEVCENNIGISYRFGQGVEKNIDTALEWFTKSAEKDHAGAQYEAGAIHYDEGRYEEAFQWFTKSAAQGDTDATLDLGECYEKGNGVKKDISEALKLYGKAIEKGHAEAKENLRRLVDALP